MYKTALAYNREKTEAIVPSMRWDGKENLAEWQNRARTKLFELLRLPLTECEENFRIEYREDRGDFMETRFDFQSEEGFYVPCHFWAPKNISGPLPLVICLQGHTTGMHLSMGRSKYPVDAEKIKSGDRDFAVRVIKEGYCALIMEQRCFGELGGTETGGSCDFSSMAALLIGRTAYGERVWDLQRGLDVIEKHFPEADKNRIICMGHSGGGGTTLYSSALDQRIKYAMPSGYFCSFDDCISSDHTPHCKCNYIPDMRLHFDMGDIAGLIAPRPLVIVLGKEDHFFPHHGVQKAFAEVRRIYTGFNETEKLRLVMADGPHRFYADPAWEAMNSFIKA